MKSVVIIKAGAKSFSCFGAKLAEHHIMLFEEYHTL